MQPAINSSNVLDPNVLRCAKQVYTNLQLKERISLLSNTSNLPPEIAKLVQLLSLTDAKAIDSVTKIFLSWSPAQEKRKKNLEDFKSLLDKELSAFASVVDEFDEFDFDDDDILAMDNTSAPELITTPTIASTGRKRTSPEEAEREVEEIGIGSKSKKVKTNNMSNEDTHLTIRTNHEYFNESQNIDYNVICSPSGGVKVFTGVSWIILYEVSRFVQCCQVPWNELPFEAFYNFLKVANNEPKKLYETMVQWNQEVRRGLKLNGLAYTSMERCPDNVWAYLKKLDADEVTQKASKLKNRMIHFSGIIQFKVSHQSPTIKLRAPKVEASNRLFRKFGHERFLELKLSKSSNPFLIRRHKDYFLKPFLFMHRTFRFLFVKDDTVILFATEGVDLTPISIQEVIDWHMPITENWNMTISKYASRMSLGYSSSIPTLVFKPNEIIYVDDVYADNDSSDETKCMTDGCGIISPAAMKSIMGCQATEELPCAIQGRIGGAKGIWIIDPKLDFTTGHYIQIRKSQHKFVTGLPQSDLELDPLHYTFDHVKNSICVYPSNLNTQFIQSLAAGGVPTSVFTDILKEYIHELANIVVENQNIKILRDWVAKTGNVMMNRWEGEEHTEKGLWNDLLNSNMEDENDSGYYSMSPDDASDDSGGLDHKISAAMPQMQVSQESIKNSYNKINKYSGFPAGLHESIVRLLDAGFDLSNAYVATRVTMVFRQVMQAITVKYKIEVPQSCTVTCIPDPTGTLQEGEIFLQLSSRKTDEKTGIRAGQILGDVVVTRNPCGLKSDVQKVKAVDNVNLRMYTDIVLFSIKGSVSLASKLSGGDYDGDIVFCCWDERIVKPFRNSSVCEESEKVKKAFEKDKSTLGEELTKYDRPEDAIQNNFISVTLPDGTLGVYENWRTVLAENRALDDPDVVYLAHMCAKLVDAPKQGLRLTGIAKSRDKNDFGGFAHPAWFMDKKNKQRETSMRSYKEVNNVYTLHDAPCTTTMDYLYDTLLKETAEFTKYSKSLFIEDDIPFKDADLTEPWLRANEQALQLNDSLLKQDLYLIAKMIKDNRDEYNTQCGEFQSQRTHYMDNIRNPSRYAENKFVDELQSRFNNYLELEEYFAKDFNSLPPADQIKSSILNFDMKANNGKMLQTIKASYSYILSVNTYKYSKYCYIVAYDILRRIKADACAKIKKDNGLAETVSISQYKAMNLDRKWIKRVKETSYNDERIERVRMMHSSNQ